MNQIMRIPLKYILVLAGLVVVAFIVLTIVNRPQPNRIDLSRAAVVKEMQSLNRLETASFTIEKIIEAGTNENAFKEFLFGDRILLIANGHVVAGVDLSKLEEKDVRVNDKTLTIQLPEPEIFSASLDSTKTKVYDRRTGFLNTPDKDLEAEARGAAETSLRQAACTGGILTEANANAQERLKQTFKLVGFDSIEVTTTPGTC